MLIWLINTGEPLPSDGPNVRVMRTGMLARALLARGNEVVWWSTNFSHFRKVQRTPADESRGMQTRLLQGMPYHRNVSLARVANHLQVGIDFTRLSKFEPVPDLIVCSVPTIDLAVASVRYGRTRNIPVVLDMRDKWPDALVELFPASRRPLASAALLPMKMALGWAARNAAAITGITPEFVEWGLAHAGRVATPLDRYIPQGYAETPPDEASLAEARAYWDRVGVRRDGFVVCHVGLVGHQTASLMGKAVEAARTVHQHRPEAQFVFCGDGEALAGLRSASASLPSIVTPGWVDRAQIFALMERSRLGLVIYEANSNLAAGWPNKFIEYLAGGLPVVSTLDGALRRLIEETGCGVHVEPPTGPVLATTIENLASDPPRLEAMAKKARELFHERFRADVVFSRYCDYLTDVVDHGKQRLTRTL